MFNKIIITAIFSALLLSAALMQQQERREGDETAVFISSIRGVRL